MHNRLTAQFPVNDDGESDTGFAAWYAGEFSRMLAALVVVTGDVELAQEATAEAFARALERWDRVGAMLSPGGWTYRVAINVARRQGRRAALERRLLASQPTTTTIPAIEMHPEVWVALRALPKRQREAVALRYLADLPEAAVAEAMGVAVGTASATLNAARRRLQAHLSPTAEELT